MLTFLLTLYYKNLEVRGLVFKHLLNLKRLEILNKETGFFFVIQYMHRVLNINAAFSDVCNLHIYVNSFIFNIRFETSCTNRPLFDIFVIVVN